LTSTTWRVLWTNRIAPWLAAGVVLSVAVWASQPYPVGVFHDDGVYVVLAKALASGEGFRYVHLPDAPHATHYPPGYPYWLAALWTLSPKFPDNVGTFQLANAVLLAATSLGVFVFARRVLAWTTGAAIAAGLLSTLTYPLLGLSGYVLSEVLFAGLLIPTLILAERAVRENAEVMDAGFAGAAAGALTLVRSNGIAVVGAVVLVLLAQRRPRLAGIAFVAALMLLGPWQLWVAAHDSQLAEPLKGAYGSYLPWLIAGAREDGIALIGGTIATNLRETGALFADRFSISDRPLPRQLTAIVVTLVVMASAARWRRRAPVTLAFIALYMAIVLVWPWNPWRFVYAIWPLVLLSFGLVLEYIHEIRVWRRSVSVALLAVFGLLAIGMLRAEVRAYASRSWYYPARDAAQRIAPTIRWVTTSTQPTDLVAVEGEPIVYLFTGRKAVPSVSFVPSQYVARRSSEATAVSMRRVLSTFPVSYVSAITLDGFRAAQLLTTPTAADSLAPRLVQLHGLGAGGGFYRVERKGSSSPRQ
jgi:hypothetical protein